jgi:hypothetical protein
MGSNQTTQVKVDILNQSRSAGFHLSSAGATVLQRAAATDAPLIVIFSTAVWS